MPGHLDGFEFGFVGFGGVAGEEWEFGDPFVHVGEAYGEGIGVGYFSVSAMAMSSMSFQSKVGGIF